MRERIISVLFLCQVTEVLNKEVATIAKTNDTQMINGAIKFPQVRLIDAEGQMVGVKRRFLIIWKKTWPIFLLWMLPSLDAR